MTYESARNLSGTLKYSKLTGGDLNVGHLETYDSEFVLGSTRKIFYNR